MHMESTKTNQISCNSIAASNRLDYIDSAKGIGILLVVIAHINYTQQLLTIIYSFHMPLFFVISGLLFDSSKYQNFKDFLTRKIRTLICPYILFYVLSVMYRVLIQLVADYSALEPQVYLKYFLQMFLSQGSEHVANAPLWFVPCLFAVEIMYFFISKMNRWGTVIISVFLTAAGWLLESDFLGFDNSLLPWSLDSALFAVGFYAFGNLISDFVRKTVSHLKSNRYMRFKCTVIVILCTSALIPIALINEKVSLGSKILNNGFLLYLTGIIGTCGVLSTGVLLEKNKFLKYCGRNSFCIMSVHYLAKDSIRMFCKFVDIPIYDRTSLIETIIPIAIVLFMSILFTALYNTLKRKILKQKTLIRN